MGNLKQDADAVAGFSLCVLAGPVLQVFYDPESIFHCLMGFKTLDIDHCSDSAVIMLKIPVIKPRQSFFRCLYWY